MERRIADTPPIPKPAVVIGAGPAGLMAAERLALGGVGVTVVDHMPGPARKMLMAGVGGLNITHDEPMEAMLQRYGPAAPHLEPALAAFPPAALRAWCHDLGQPTFVGSSRRVFPVAMKAAPLVRAWLQRLDRLGVTFRFRHRWLGWDTAGMLRTEPDRAWPACAVVLACGGASWPRLGSDGAWIAALAPSWVTPLQPANCGFAIAWSAHFRARFEGAPLKRILVRFRGHAVPGDAVVTALGIEGGPFYALSAPLRDAIASEGHAVATVDLRPDLSAAEIARRCGASRRGQSTATFLRKAVGLSPVAINLLHEYAATADDMPRMIKALPLRLTAPAPLARAISTAGGVKLDRVQGWSVAPGVFVAGEMLDWEAPTGGYLLQGALSTGFAAGEAALAWVRADRDPAHPGTLVCG